MTSLFSPLKVYVLGTYFLLVVYCDFVDEHTLELVHVVFRHGSRINEKREVYPNDPYGASNSHPLNYGQLTNHGKQQAYQLGKLLRNKYKDFLDGDMPSDTVWAESTAFTRTQMTVLLVLAGLFPPTATEKWSNHFDWTPIPYYYRKLEQDFVLWRVRRCPAYDQELERFLQSEQVLKFAEEHSETFAYIREHSGMQINDLNDVFVLHQTLDSEATRNLRLPDWTRTVYPDEIKLLATKALLYDNGTPLLKRLYAGRLLKIILKRMLEKSENSLLSTTKKLILYSGHDNNVLGMLVALDLAPYKFPEYCSAVTIELYKSKTSNEFFVKIFHIKNELSEPEEKFISGCNGICSLSEFSDFLRPYIPENLTEECGSSVLLE